MKQKLSLSEFRKLSDEEICARVNEQMQKDKHSTKEAMSASGYDFSWTSMKKEAENRGLQEGFFDPNSSGVKYVDSVPERIDILLKGKENGVRRSYTFEKADVDRLDSMTRNFKKDADKSAIVSALMHYALDAFDEAIRKGELHIIREVPELYMPANEEAEMNHETD